MHIISICESLINFPHSHELNKFEIMLERTKIRVKMEVRE